MEKLSVTHVKEIFKEIKKVIDENKDFLVRLDAAMGDGDLGITMATGFGAIVKELEKIDDPDVGNVIAKMGMIMANIAPSTMGTLMATAMMKAGKCVKGSTEIGLKEAVDMGFAAIEGIKQRGKSEVGDKTILDSLYPATIELEKAINEGLILSKAFKNALKAAEEGVENTKTMVSKHGRAAYYGERSIGNQDPGATVGMLVIKGICNYLNR